MPSLNVLSYGRSSRCDASGLKACVTLQCIRVGGAARLLRDSIRLPKFYAAIVL